MRRLALVLALAGAAATPASAAQIMVVGRSGETLVSPRAASAKGAKVKVDGKRCRVAGRTPLAALARTKVRLSLRDYGACGRRPADAGALYVQAVAGQRERGRAGWVYKLDNQVPGTAAGDPGTRVGRRTRLLWFWCQDASGCQRTLAVTPRQRQVAAGGTLTVAVRAHDDFGRAVPAAGATVTLGSARATAGADGIAKLPAGARTGRLPLVAMQAGRVRSFPERVEVT